VREIFCRAGDIVPSGSPFMRIETADASQAHLKVNGESSPPPPPPPPAPPPPPGPPAPPPPAPPPPGPPPPPQRL
jgi:pyruvate/2-oxoglutarate dehydrogenase complex dihydrolipoamide acyltransferase (E2) component